MSTEQLETWKTAIEKFQSESISKLDRYYGGAELDESVKILSDKLTKLGAQGSTSTDDTITEEDQKKAIVRNAILEANKIFFQTLNQVAEMPSATPKEKWVKLKAVLDACNEYQEKLDESGFLSDVDRYIEQMAITCGCNFVLHMIVLSIAAILLSIAITSIFSLPSQFVPALVGACIASLLISVMEIRAVLYEKARLETKMQSALNSSHTPESHHFGLAIMNPSRWVNDVEFMRKFIFQKFTDEEGTRKTYRTLFGAHAPARLAGEAVITDLIRANAPTLPEYATAKANEVRQYASSFWTTQKPTVTSNAPGAESTDTLSLLK